MQPSYPVTAITVTHNSLNVLPKFIHSLQSLKVAEIIVVDAGSTDGSLDYLEGCNVQIIKERNIGFGRANNIGFSAASQEFILFLNPDVLIEPSDFENIFQFFSERSSTSIISTKMYQKIKGEKVLTRESIFEGEYKSVEKVSGAFMLMSKKSFETLDGFDNNLFLYFDEIDLCKRAVLSGIHPIIFGGSTIEHIRAGSTPISFRYDLIRGWHDGWSKLYFINKHNNSSISVLLIFTKTIFQTFLKLLSNLLVLKFSRSKREGLKLIGMLGYCLGLKSFVNGVGRFTDY